MMETDHDIQQAHVLAQLSSAIGTIASMQMNGMGGGESSHTGRQTGAQTIKRVRKDMDEYLGSMDGRLFRRKYRMERDSFYRLLDILGDHLPSTGEKRKRGMTPNGPITKAARLSMAIRYCAGGDTLDIADIHGVHTAEVISSVWDIIDAIHASPELNITYPEDHNEQMAVADGFRHKSAVNMDCCAGAIDGMLVWMNKPSTKDVKVIKFGASKFFCGRKYKYGLNMLAVCDSKRRFMWVEARFPGAASDYYAFDDSHLKKKIEKEGFLRPGLCIFGDNAYVNSPYMCTPWRNVSQGPKDGFNFFHSQLRINIECAFGMLVHRWGMLRKPIAVNISVKRATSLVYALCKLHNFCISQHDDRIEQPTDKDKMNIAVEGGLYLPRLDNNKEAYWDYDMSVLNSRDRVSELLDGGDHTNDHDRHQRRKFRFNTDLPCYTMLHDFTQNCYSRPPISKMRMNKQKK